MILLLIVFLTGAALGIIGTLWVMVWTAYDAPCTLCGLPFEHPDECRRGSIG